MERTAEKLTWFEQGVKKGWIGIYEQELVRFLEEERGSQPEDIKLCVVFTSLFVKAGHVCLPLDKSPEEWISLLDLDTEYADILTKQAVGTDVLYASKWVGKNEKSPFVLEGNRLFIGRYWWYEYIVSQCLKEFTSKQYEKILNKPEKDFLNFLFPVMESSEMDWQKAAAVLSLIKNFLLISGGPGTGKTTTVAKIIALLLRTSTEPLRIALAAPTGKAAARMGEALSAGVKNMPLTENEKQQIPAEAMTLHRLLSGFEYKGLFPSSDKKRLPYDLIIVDEASMIDLTLMHRLLSFTAPETKLILLGDKDQLASVESGAVLADICGKDQNGFNVETAEFLTSAGLKNVPVTQQSSVDDSIVYLEKSWRFDAMSGIGKLAENVKKPQQQSGQQNLFHSGETGSSLRPLFTEYLDLEHIPFHYQTSDLHLLFDDITSRLRNCQGLSPENIFTQWQQKMWLSVLRNGPFGSRKLNWLIEKTLLKHRVITPEQDWYQGRPVMVTQNDYPLGVFNGDTGICTIKNEKIWIHFPDEQGFKKTRAKRITHAEPAYVMTVHKSQGSEFDRVNLLLPKNDTPILTRELIYTAITRARKTFALYGSVEMLEKGGARKTERFTGLRDKLNGKERAE